MAEHGLKKAEKLCSKMHVDMLFSKGKSIVAYPVRCVYKTSARTDGAPVQFMITVPKKHIRHAVDRVLLRRRIRESYRLNKDIIVEAAKESDKRFDLAFIYITDSIKDYAYIERKMQKLLNTIVERQK